jgi:hypothetical protein
MLAELEPRIGTCLFAFVLRVVLGGRIRCRRSKSTPLLPHFGLELKGFVWSFEPLGRVMGPLALLREIVFLGLFVGRWKRLTVQEFYDWTLP